MQKQYGFPNSGQNTPKPNRCNDGQSSHSRIFNQQRRNIVCKFCNLMGHETRECRKLQRFLRDNNVSLEARFGTKPLVNTTMAPIVSHFAAHHQQPWLFDSGASHHTTSDPSILHSVTEYGGPDEIHLGDGTSLSISHTGQTTLPASNHDLSLSSVLCVPQLQRNLVSVSKLCKSNNVSVKFFDTYFCVKDRSTGALLQRWKNALTRTRNSPAEVVASQNKQVIPYHIYDSSTYSHTASLTPTSSASFSSSNQIPPTATNSAKATHLPHAVEDSTASHAVSLQPQGLSAPLASPLQPATEIATSHSTSQTPAVPVSHTTSPVCPGRSSPSFPSQPTTAPTQAATSQPAASSAQGIISQSASFMATIDQIDEVPVTRKSQRQRKPNQKYYNSMFINLTSTHTLTPLLEPTTVSQAQRSPYWRNAMSEEFQALLRNDTWELVPPRV
ncbi:PREDICTED: uncharacterized protein LOC109156293 [Ipomoea nil]|uniref:uncharacterized protein LOC109156293 n=1 Tax=Ipomoea nil TaxID=35883 RepID=UPI000901EC39|nr:PREDICTED: uncharacterized protein LOC109156293 [Ipomoea nil]